uniref:Protein kinase domain-containing protein n=1 Tax=Pyxicephalus adspersus TaxID=30357 RepID=A0AAV2ZHH5_PYXAD|nr:TPA: hypothetical protein GDO54_002268 [Pyxicephalus adspersus]
MENLGHVFAVAQTIYSLCDQASSNKKQCSRLKRRIKMLLLTSETLSKQKDKSLALHVVVGELGTTLENAKCWVINYSHHAWWKRVLQANSIKEEFNLINDRLGDAADQLSLLLAAEQRQRFFQYFKEKTRRRENAKDLEEDLKELRSHLSAHLEDQKKSMDDAIGDLSSKLDNIGLVCRQPNWNITEIRATDLKRGDLLLDRPSHFLYRGEFHRSPVAIKVFKDQNAQSEEFIRRTFMSESQTMRKFECLNILRLYGICIDNSGPETCYSLVMELCEKGTLRELLQTEPDLPWDRRVLMALDAARALYRLHQTEMKAILHGSLSSFKYLVDGTYCVKLYIWITEGGGTPNNKSLGGNEKVGGSSLYHSDVFSSSLGVVMYEIAAGKPAFQGESCAELLLLPINTELC